MRKELPLLEFDPSSKAVIEPSKRIKPMDIPESVVICFFNDVIAKLKNEGKLKYITCMTSEVGEHPIYELKVGDRAVTLFHPGVGAPLCAGMLEEVIALGGRKFIACGGAGVLDRSIAVGHIIVPVAAVRDEGTSYHYLPPSREVQVNRKAVLAIEEVLIKHKCNYILAKTWTTDAIYRETPDKINLRRQEGCLTVEMECSAFCAVAEFRKVIFGQILYGGDDVSCEEWDSRGWNTQTDVREEILNFAVEASLYL